MRRPEWPATAIVAIAGCALAFVLATALQVHAQRTYTQQATIAQDAAFITRVELAAVKVALDVTYEAETVDKHATRVALAYKVLQSPEALARLLAWGVVADQSTTDATTDALLYTRMAGIWNAYAGP